MQNKVLFLLTLVFLICSTTFAQRGVRVAYIDTEYILQNVPEYQEASVQLDEKAEKWKNEIQDKLAIIEQKRKDLSNEKVLLTKELIEEREEDIYFEEQEILNYQQNRFGPNGDLFIQKKQLMQPIQDQIFAAVQDLAESRKYDLVFDKSETNLLYSNKAYDLSEQILRSITRASKRQQAESKAEKKAAEDEELLPEINYELEAREKALEEKKAARLDAIEKAKQEKLDAREAKVKEAKERRENILKEREKAQQEKLNTTSTSSNQTTASDNDNPEVETKTRAQLIEENRQKKLAERAARQKALDEKRKKILEDRQKAKDSTNNN